MSASKTKKVDLAAKIKTMQAAREAGQALYKQADLLQDEIEKEWTRRGRVIDLGNGLEAERVDPWKVKTKVWRHTGVRRWEIEIRSASAAALTTNLES